MIASTDRPSPTPIIGAQPAGAILVTGAAGFLGANIVISLARRGLPVLAADRQAPPPELLRALDCRSAAVEWLTLDVRCSCDWAAVPGAGVGAVIHAAAVTSGEDDPDPTLTCDVNTGGTVKALTWARERGVERFVYVSSSAVYRGIVVSCPLLESLPLRPTTPYGQSKVAAEGFVDLYRRVWGLKTAIARLPSLYGPWERPNPHRPLASPVYHLAQALRSGKSTVRAAGADVGRDWTYVGDAAQGLMHLATMDAPPQLVNLSLGRMVSLREIAAVLSQLSGACVDLVGQDPGGALGGVDVQMTPTSGGQPMDVGAMAAAGFTASTLPAEGLRRYWQWLAEPGRAV